LSNPDLLPRAPVTRDAFWFSHPFRVRYAEADRRGHLFNAHYLTYFGTALVEYLRALPFDIRTTERAAGAAIHVVRSTVDIATPVRFDDPVDVCARVARLGRSSLTFAVAVFRPTGGDALAAGEMVWVYTHQATRKSTPWPDSLREIVARREGAALVTV
jgi:acyl-CoA thioester hydrolase